MTLEKQLEELESRIKGLERKLDAVLNILVSDLYEEELPEHPFPGQEEEESFTRLN